MRSLKDTYNAITRAGVYTCGASGLSILSGIFASYAAPFIAPVLVVAGLCGLGAGMITASAGIAREQALDDENEERWESRHGQRYAQSTQTAITNGLIASTISHYRSGPHFR